MPQVAFGAAPVTNVRLGTTQVQKVYYGTTQIWSASSVWAGSPADISLTVRSSVWGPIVVPSGKTVHWDASNEASFTYFGESNLVSKWEDLSGNDWWLKEPVPGLQQPSRVIGYNGVPCVEFEGEEWLVHWIDSGTPADINLAQPITIHIVASTTPIPGSVTGLIGGQGTGAGGFQVTVQTETQILFAAGNFINYAYNTDRHLITAVYNGASGSLQRVDGVLLGTANPGTSPLQRLQIGITHNVMYTIACEYVIYNRVLTGPEIAYNENLLMRKWFAPPGVWTRSEAAVSVAGSARTWYRGATPAFRPDYIENCWGWWDATDASTFTFGTGVSVAQWGDKAAGHHLTAPSTGDQPDRTGTLNGLPVVTFDGAAWMFTGEGPTGFYTPPQPYTVFWVGNVMTGSNYGLLGGSGGVSINRQVSTNLLTFGGIGTTHTLDTSAHLISAVYDRGLSQQRIDGEQVGAVNTGGFTQINQFRIGTGSEASYKMLGTVAEVCLYTRNLNSTEIDEVEAYLTAKWFGPPLPQTWTGSSATLSATATTSVWGALLVPGAPTGVAGTAGSGLVNLSWTAPADAGGSPVTSYVVEHAVSPPGTTWNSGGTSATTAKTVTGLTNGTSYIFRVSAVNSVGQGPPSSSSSAVTPTAAGPYDDFNRANNSSLGSNWLSITTDQMQISSNRATAANGNGKNCVSQWVTALGSADHEATAVLVIGGDVNTGGMEVRCRMPSGVDSGYAVQAVGGGWGPPSGSTSVRLVRITAGAEVDIGGGFITLTSTPSTSHTLKVTATGSTIKGFVNGTERFSTTDATHSTGTYVGLRMILPAENHWAIDSFGTPP